MNKEDIWEAKRKKYMDRIAEMCLMNDSFMSVSCWQRKPATINSIRRAEGSCAELLKRS